MPPKLKLGKDQASDTAVQLKSLKEAMDNLIRENEQLKAKVNESSSMNTCPCNSEKKGKVQWLECANEDCTTPTWHATCAGFDAPKEAVTKSLKGLWRCPYCVVTKFPKEMTYLEADQQIKDDIIKIKDDINQEVKKEISQLTKFFENKFQDIETKCFPNMVSQISKKVESSDSYASIVSKSEQENEGIVNKLAAQVVKTQKQLMADKEERENNIMIFNVPENINEGDESFFKSMCTDALGLSEQPAVKISRIGKTENSGYSRPIKVRFEQQWKKRTFLSSLYKLKNNSKFTKITVSHDMNKEDRLQNKQLLRQAYEMNLTNQSNDFKFKVRGPPWEMKIVKVYTSNKPSSKQEDSSSAQFKTTSSSQPTPESKQETPKN